MGKHVGWKVVPDQGTYRGKVLLPNGKYRSKRFTNARDARAWAVATADDLRRRGPLTGPAAGLTEDLARDYLDELASLGRAASTLTDLRVIFGGLAREVPRLDAPSARADLSRWIGAIESSGAGRGGRKVVVGPARRNKYLVCVRALCRWAVLQERLATDPSDRLRMASVDSKIKPQFSIDELRLLLDAPDGPSRRWVALMVYLGLRSDEARCLRWQDLDWQGRVALVSLQSGAQVKRRRERMVPIPAELAELLRPLAGAPGAAVAGLGRGNIQRTWDDYLAARKLVKGGRTAHSCRHTYAGLLTATGVPTALVGAYLGHTSAQTTLGYTALAARYAQDERVRALGRGELRIRSLG